MTSPAKTLYLALDACDLDVVQAMTARGELPNIGGLLQSAAVVETRAAPGFFVSSHWASMFTGLTASRHGYVCWDEIVGGTYEYRETNADALVGTPFWEVLSDRGCRVAVLDAPHARLASDLNGVQLVEWGGHDRHRDPSSWPPEFLAVADERYGLHPIGRYAALGRQWAPCDYMYRSSAHRDLEENTALLADLREGLALKRALSLDLLQRGGWDLFYNVMSESHCAGHQWWHLHDPTAPRYDADVARALGGDPMALIYRELDAVVGDHLALVDEETAVYVHLSHGMRPHYDGTHLLDPVLWRLDQYVAGGAQPGPFGRSADRLTGVLPRALRHPTASALARNRRRIAPRYPYAEFTDELPPRLDRRWWAQPNNSVSGSVRLNLDGREPEGMIRGPRSRDVACWLAARLRELVNLDTGERVVEQVILTDDHYERFDGDAFGDLIIEWNRASPIERVWSPATGVVYVPYTHWRTGDHDRRGLLMVSAPGVTPGRRSEPLDAVHMAPTLAASLGVELPDVDGVADWDLVPAVHRPARQPVVVRSIPDRPADDRIARRWSTDYEIPQLTRVHQALRGLQYAHHLTRQGVDAARADLERHAGLEPQVKELERLALIATQSAWLRQLEIPESMLVSIITPTRNRSAHLSRAIASVRAQRYQRWEMLIVDDGSDDDTWPVISNAAAHDERIRPFRVEHAGVSAARNHALDHAAGDVIVYLDDDNRFDPDWLRAVVWAFAADANRRVLYGARLVDDHGRHHGGAPDARPWLQFLEWDSVAIEEFNRTDINALAHRPSTSRFDEQIAYYADWDLLLQLTDDTVPFELPVVATYYTTDAKDRLTETYPEVIDLEYERVREKTAQRRAP